MGIRLSKNHGLNPAIPVCFFCFEQKNEIVLPGILKGDVEAPRAAVWDRDPCDRCGEVMKTACLLLEGTSDKLEDRTGRMWGIKDRSIKELFSGLKTPALLESTLKYRFCIIEPHIVKLFGLDKLPPRKFRYGPTESPETESPGSTEGEDNTV